MGISFHKDMRIAGYRPATFKNGLLGLERTRSPASMIDLKSVFPQRRDGAIVFEECLNRRLIETQDGFQLTPGGEAMVRGKTKPRMPLAKAQALLDEFLARVHALNSDENAVRYVDEVWLFGSVLRGAETVGDIDLALVTDRRPQYRIKGGYEQMKAHLTKVMANRDDVPQSARLPLVGRALDHGTRAVRRQAQSTSGRCPYGHRRLGGRWQFPAD